MFSQLSDMSVKRSIVSAIGFYVAATVALFAGHLIVGVVATFALGGVSEPVISIASELATAVTAVLSIVICLSILWHKGWVGSMPLLFLASLSGLGSLMIGPWVGAVVPAAFSILRRRRYVRSLPGGPVISSKLPSVDPVERLFPSGGTSGQPSR